MRGTFEEPPTGLIPWFSKTESNIYAALLHHPFLFKVIPTQCSRGSIVVIINLPPSPISWCSPPCVSNSSLIQCTCTIIIIHIVRSCKWKAIMTIYDGLIEMREDGMNSTHLVFVNMISSSFPIQPIMNETCLQWQLEIIVAYAMLNLLGVYNGLPCVPTCY